MKFKTTIVGEDWGYYEINDETDLYEDVQSEGQEKADKYFRCGVFKPDEIKHHFIDGFLDYLYQSDHCPINCYEKKIVNYILEKVKD